MNRTFAAILLTLLALAAFPLFAQEKGDVGDRLLDDLKTEKPPAATAPEAPKGWAALAQEMRRIAAQIPDASASENTLSSQTALIGELTKLLEQARPGSTALAASASPQNRTDRNAASKTEEGKTGSHQNPGASSNGPASKGTAAGNAPGDPPAETAKTIESLMRRAWGQFPGRIRDRLNAAPSEKFHSKYQSETENYFRRLAEQEHRP